MEADTLKIRYKARNNGGSIEFNPADLSVELNGKPLHLVQSLTIHIENGPPHAKIGFFLEGIDIDADSLLALQAIVNTQKVKAHGEATSESN